MLGDNNNVIFALQRFKTENWDCVRNYEHCNWSCFKSLNFIPRNSFLKFINTACFMQKESGFLLCPFSMKVNVMITIEMQLVNDQLTIVQGTKR